MRTQSNVRSCISDRTVGEWMKQNTSWVHEKEGQVELVDGYGRRSLGNERMESVGDI